MKTRMHLLAMIVALGALGGTAAMAEKPADAPGAAKAAEAREKEKGEKGEQAPKPAGIHGEIIRVEPANLLVRVKKQGEKETTDVEVRTDANTKIKLNGKEAVLTDLHPGMHVQVQPATGVATRIMATAKKKEKAVREPKPAKEPKVKKEKDKAPAAS